MQMSRSLLPKPAAAPAHSNSVPGLVFCLVGAGPVDPTLLKLWVVEQSGPCRQERQPATRNTHLFLGKEPLGLSMGGDQHSPSASWPPGGVMSRQWPLLLVAGWSSPGCGDPHPVAPSHSHPLDLPTLGRQWQDQCSWLYLPRCSGPLALGTLYSEHGYVVQRLEPLLIKCLLCTKCLVTLV